MAEKGNMCEGCNAPCCTLLVELNTYDINRMRKAVDDDEAGFVELSDAADEDLGFKANGRILRYVLKRKPSGECIFLENKGKLRCRIYKNKPSICTTYPFKEVDGKVVVKKKAGCPRKAGWEADDEYRERRAKGNLEWERYFKIMDEWNARAGGYEEPMEFAVFAFRKMDEQNGLLWHLKMGVKEFIEGLRGGH